MERIVSPIRIVVTASTAIAWLTIARPPDVHPHVAAIILGIAAAAAVVDLYLVYGPSHLIARWPWGSTILDVGIISSWIVASGGAQSPFVALAFVGLTAAIMRNPPLISLPVTAVYAFVVLICAGAAHWYIAAYVFGVGAGLTVWTAVAYRDRRASLRDDLTGSFTRDYADFRLGDLYRQSAFPIALAVIDLDGFKGVNDSFGHPAGDGVLVQAVRSIATAIRQGDLLARSGGDEFMLILPRTDADAAVAIAERVRVGIEVALFRHRRDLPPVRLTASIGVAVADDLSVDRASLISRADERLYAAKQAGRNRVAI